MQRDRIVRRRKNPELRKESRSNHVRPRPPLISLYEPGRLRTDNVLALLRISQTTLYARLKEGTVPPPDGRDGRRLYWNTRTIREHLEAASDAFVG